MTAATVAVEGVAARAADAAAVAVGRAVPAGRAGLGLAADREADVDPEGRVAADVAPEAPGVDADLEDLAADAASVGRAVPAVVVGLGVDADQAVRAAVGDRAEAPVAGAAAPR